MRKRDLGILLLSLFSVFISLQHEGPFSFRGAWHHGLPWADSDSFSENYQAVHTVPPPVVLDLNGDGRKEIIYASIDGNLQVIEPTPHVTRDSFQEPRILAQVTTLPRSVGVRTGSQPVALAAGYLDGLVSESGHKVRVRRKAVIVMVTAGWSVLCFDHNLKLMWENNIQEDFPHGSQHKEVAILITNQTMHVGDRGVIIVGGSMEVLPQTYLDPLEEEELEEEEEARHRKRAAKNETLEDVSHGSGAPNERHFSYYAFNGADGEMRWKHDSKDFHRDAAALSERLLPQHNYKLDANALTAKHYGEVECREYRESVLAAMPHRWTHRDDTKFELSHFRKHRRRPHKAQPGHRQGSGSTPKSTAGTDPKNKVAAVLGKAVRMAASDRKKPQGSHHGNLSHHPWAPNAIVVHLKEGIEAIHLYSGRSICKLLLTDGGLHADINGDGVLDHIQVLGSSSRERFVITGSHEPLQHCWAVATSGVPVRETLFNGSICRSARHNLFQDLDSINEFGNEDAEEGPLEVATPLLMPKAGGQKHARRSHGDVIFLNSKGDVTSYEPDSLKSHHGKLRWQVSTSAAWRTIVMPAGMETGRVAPTLEAISIRAGQFPNAILAAGDSSAVILSPNGYTVASFDLPLHPSAPLLVVDFNGDGWNDIIAVTAYGLYGFVQVRHPGMALISALLGFLIVAISVVFVTEVFVPSKGKKPRRRSTD